MAVTGSFKEDEAFQPYLKRMGLEDPEGVGERLMRAILVSELSVELNA